MSVSTTTHLNFTGQARAALEFYASVFGGELIVITYGDFGMPAGAPDADKVVFGQVSNGQGFQVMAYDVPGAGATDLAATTPATRREHGLTVTNQPFFLSARAASLAEAEPIWTELLDGGAVIEDFGPTQWAPAFGMLTDKFGVTWIVDAVAPYNA